MGIFKAICLGIITACLGWFLIEASITFRWLRFDSHEVTLKLDAYIGSLEWPTQNALAQIAATGKVLSQVGAEERNAFASQQKYYVKLTSDTDKLLSDADTAVRSVNDIIVPSVGRNLDSSDLLLRTAGTSVNALVVDSQTTLESFRPAIANLTQASAAAASAMSDPAIHETLIHVDGTAGNLDATSSDIHAYVHRITTPVRGTWAIIKELLGLTYQTRGALAR